MTGSEGPNGHGRKDPRRRASSLVEVCLSHIGVGVGFGLGYKSSGCPQELPAFEDCSGIRFMV